MGCGCKKKGKVYNSSLTTYTVAEYGGDQVTISAKSAIKVSLNGIVRVLTVGSSLNMGQNSANDLISQGAPIWIVQPTLQ